MTADELGADLARLVREGLAVLETDAVDGEPRVQVTARGRAEIAQGEDQPDGVTVDVHFGNAVSTGGHR